MTPAQEAHDAVVVSQNTQSVDDLMRVHSSAARSAPSQLPFKDAFKELEAAVRRTQGTSSAVALRLRQSAEKRLGMEVDIEDPALRDMFFLHVSAVEDLCSKVRSQADGALAAAASWSTSYLGPSVASFKLLCDADLGDGSDLSELIGSDIRDADAAWDQAQKRFIASIQSDVFAPIEERLQAHVELRKCIRERKRWSAALSAARQDVARVKRSLTAFPSGAHEQAELRLKEASDHVSRVDLLLLDGLLELQAGSVDAVRKPWASLLQLQADFFASQQTAWAPLIDSFSDMADSNVAETSSNDQYSAVFS